MYCTNCGKEIADGVKFCTNCGAAVNNQTVTPPVVKLQDAPTPIPDIQPEVPAVEKMGDSGENIAKSGNQPEKKKMTVPKKPLIIAAAVLVLIVGFGAILSLFGGGSESDSDIEVSDGLDWVEKIPLVAVNNETLSNETAEFFANYWKESIYPELEAEFTSNTPMSPDKWFGMPVIDDAQYYAWGGGYFVRKNSETVYALTLYTGSEQKAFSSFSVTAASGDKVFSATPLIVKNTLSGMYLLICKNNNSYNILMAIPSDPTSHYSTWPIAAYIVVSNKEYCGFLNGDVPVEVVSIPSESGSGDSGVTDIGTAYSQYTGTWAVSDIGWIYGGQILDIAVNGDSMSVEYSEIQSAPASRVASVSKTIPISEIQDNVVTTSFEDDGWGHSGTMSLTFTADAIICEIKDIQEHQPAQWGVIEGKFLLVRNDAAHEAMEYEPGEYEKMFPDTGFDPPLSGTSWTDDIPIVPGFSDLYYFEDEGVQAHRRLHDFVPGGVEDFIGFSDSEQVSYSTADISGGTVCFGQGPDRTVSYAEISDEPLESIGNYYYMVSETEPVIGKRDDGYCFLFYKRDYLLDGYIDSHSYEIYMVQQTDSPNYKDWLFRAYIYVNAPEFYDYLNGTKELEIISIPDQSP